MATASNTWYAAHLAGCRKIHAAASPRVFSVVTAAIRLTLAGRGGTRVITTEGTSRPLGLILVMLASALFRKRNIIVLEFLPGFKRGISGKFVRLAYRVLIGRSVCFIQVMTEWELEQYAVEYRIPRDIIRHVPFYSFDPELASPMLDGRVQAPQGYVLASGRNSCDWGYVSRTASVSNAPFVLVTSAADENHVKRLMSGSAPLRSYKIYTEITPAEHRKLLEQASVFLLSLTDSDRSSGHVRLMTCASAGVPVVAIRARGISGYEHLIATLLERDDEEGCAAALESFASDSQLRARTSRMIQERAAQYTVDDYMSALSALLLC